MKKPETPKTSKVKSRYQGATQINWVEGEKRTQQHFRDEVDINNIVARFERTGQLPQASGAVTYGDVTSYDFMHMMNIVAKQKAKFMAYPAKIRNMFNNDPAQLLTFLEDPENHDHARKLGILPKLPKVVPEGPNGAGGSNTPYTPKTPPAAAEPKGGE